MTNIFVGRWGGKKQYDKKAAVKRQPKLVAQFCRSVKDMADIKIAKNRQTLFRGYILPSVGYTV